MENAQVIFLNGPSSSGKSSLAHALQLRLDKPYLFVAEDMFFGMLPNRDFPQATYMRYGQRLYNGFAACARTLVDCGNSIIIDTVAWNPGSMAEFVRALWDVRVFAVGVHCPLSVLEERERQRGDRGVGLARRQYATVHKDALYDLEIDTSTLTSEAAAERVIIAMAEAASAHAFARMKACLL